MVLTLFAIQKARPRDKLYKLADGNGLYLHINPNGKKQWRFRYSFAGKENMLAFGTYPEISLASARKKRDEMRTLVAEGIDPSLKRKADKVAAANASRNTLGAIADEYLDHLRESGRAVTTMEKNTWLLNDLAAPFRKRPIKDINAAEILALLRKVEKTGRRETARRLRGTLGSVFRYAIATLRAEHDPTFALRGVLLKPVVTHRSAITDEAKFGALLLAIDEYDGWPTIRAAVKFLALTMARPGDVRFMRRSEVNFVKATWSIPAGRMKMRRPHNVPLSTQALEILKDIWELSKDDGYVFPAIRSASKPLSEVAMNSALRRLGYSKEEMCAHGFRSSASTILNERGFNPDVIETSLAHQDQNSIRRAYNRATYWPERIKLMQSWADMLDEFKRLAVGSGRAA